MPFIAKMNLFGVKITKLEWHTCRVRFSKKVGGEMMPLEKGGELTKKLIGRLFEQEGIDMPFIYDGAPTGNLYTYVRQRLASNPPGPTGGSLLRGT